MVMPTIVSDRFASLDYIDYTNNHVFLKRSTNSGFHEHHDNHHHHGGQDPVGPSAKELIGNALHQRVEKIDHEFCEPGDEDTFFVADLGEVYRQHLRWKLNLPRVKPFYAVKCNPDQKLLELLAALGTGFDCASKAEIEQVLRMGVDPSRIIYAQPCKTNSYVRYVASHGVRQMTFDNADELRKIARLFPDAELFLRILTDDSSSLCRLSLKFGASLDSTDGLLALAHELGLNVVGVSFHVGSGASDPGAFLKAVQDAHVVFQQAAAYGFHLKTLDVGGGFCSDDTFEEMAGVLRAALDDYFPAHSGINLIAEPGRYYASSAYTLACNIIARRTIADMPQPISESNGGAVMAINDRHTPSGDASYMLYVNDGLYGNFSSIMFDHQNPVAKALRVGGRTLYDTPAAEGLSSPTGGVEYSIWGPTCDGIDRITQSIRFSLVLDVGDWLYFEDMGAYTKCSATTFNGFSNEHDVIYVCSEPGAKALLGMH
ncbi:pyridoxal-dependent decarboxylase [Apodospora peruviana]|uniref:Ornithine decarboxylase n=1 Tax=Apodospora peruviana TaxID=516989 RepID=A0AAE0IIQ9_9PEZI|nr:pyridoxal-dependent decarboxylase [Apodospora peruviana]